MARSSHSSFMRILLVEDDSRTASFIIKGLKRSGYAMDHAADGQEAYHRLSTESYDVAIVDIMLPKLNGLLLVEQIRKEGCITPVIFLSAKRELDDRIRGLQSGGDDYLVKPFAFAELLARIQALIRRGTVAGEATRLVVGTLELDLAKRRVTREGRIIELQPREFALLEYLMRNAGRVVSKTMIMEHVWDYNFDPATSVVDTCICRLRTKLDEGFSAELIRTMRGAGYALDIPQ